MSADNTVIVLRTKGRNGADSEYRVAHTMAAENMYDYPSQDNPRLNRIWALNTFMGARVFTSADDAMKEANRIERLMMYVEYGIRVIYLSDVFFPASDRKRRQRRFVRHGHQRVQTAY